MNKKMRVWWIPQVPMDPFYIDVVSVEDGVRIMDVLANYDKFQFENRIKPDYCNCGGIEVFDTEDTEDNPDGSWVSWIDEETGEDNPYVYLSEKNNKGLA